MMTTDYFSGHNNLKIFYRNGYAHPEKARLIIAHGLGEHSGRYQQVIHRMISEGLSVWALDFCGHGRSEGKRGHIESFDQYVTDLDKLVDIAVKDAPQDTKILLLGHSLGGLIALNYAIRFPDKLNGLMLSSPALGLNVQVPTFKAVLGKFMSTVWPGLSMANELDPTKISHDRSVVDAYIQDPLVHDRVTARWFTEFVSTMARTQQSATAISVPTLMQIAGSDFLVDAAASEEFFNRLQEADKTIHVYSGLFHEIFNEKAAERTVVLDDLSGWIQAHI